jgi:hypothetical protein
MTRQRLGITHIHHPLEQAKRIEALDAAFVTASDPKGEQRTEIGPEILMSNRI